MLLTHWHPRPLVKPPWLKRQRNPFNGDAAAIYQAIDNSQSVLFPKVTP